MVFIEYISFLYQYFKYPSAFLGIIPAIIILWLLIRKDWVKFTGDDATAKAIKRRKHARFVVLALRTLAFIALFIAIASYFTEREVFIEGDPYLRIIVDNSSSFSLYDQDVASELAGKISKNIRVETTYIGDEDSTPLGDAILSSITSGANVLVISDGQSNTGADLGDVALYASRLNASLSSLTLEPLHNDLRVSIRGPSKTLADIENTYTISLDRVGEIGPVRVVVKIDGQIVKDETTTSSTVKVSKTFTDGYHRVEALVDIEDFFPQNNVFYKSVKVVQKPKVALVTTDHSPLDVLLNQIYEVDTVSDVPVNLDDYHAVVINNKNTDQLTDTAIDRLVDFSSEGNGMMVVGGKNSFERGAYKDSRFEQMLPVYVAEAGKEEGDINVVLVIDISGSTGTAVAPGQSEAIHINKAQAIAVYGDLRPENYIGVVAFNSQGFIIEPMGLILEKVGLVEKIAKIRAGGGTLISAGMMEAINMLKATDGSKNMILISDGKTQLFSTSVEAAELAERLGIKIYTVGVGARRNDFVLQKLAEIGHGIFFPADQSSKLKILFGDVEDSDKSRFGLAILDESHFITDGLEIVTMITGYNPVVPKSTSNLLVTTDVGDPVLTVWRYGLGRIAALTTDDGTRFAGELLNKQNSPLITRTMNWIIGDPDRKADNFIDIPDTHIDEPTKLLVRSPSTPSAQGVVFFKVEEDLYSSTIVPEKQGFQQIMSAVFAVNYKREFADLGDNPRLTEIVEGTGGSFYTTDQVEEIIDQVESRSKRAVVKKVFIRWPFIILAMICFLLDIFLRRLYKTKKYKER